MGIKFDYDFGTNEVLIDDAPEGSTVIVNGTKYVPERTCKYDYFQDAREANWLDKVECQGYHVLECGHRVPGDYFERPNYCCVCGKKVK